MRSQHLSKARAAGKSVELLLRDGKIPRDNQRPATGDSRSPYTVLGGSRGSTTTVK